MKNYDYWKSFAKTGKIDDYLHYIACTREEGQEGSIQEPGTSILSDGCFHVPHEQKKEGGFGAGINYRDGNGSVSHADW